MRRLRNVLRGRRFLRMRCSDPSPSRRGRRGRQQRPGLPGHLNDDLQGHAAARLCALTNREIAMCPSGVEAGQGGADGDGLPGADLAGDHTW